MKTILYTDVRRRYGDILLEVWANHPFLTDQECSMLAYRTMAAELSSECQSVLNVLLLDIKTSDDPLLGLSSSQW